MPIKYNGQMLGHEARRAIDLLERSRQYHCEKARD